MLKIATVFSGIGAIEHSLERMGIDHEVVFASDNGDLNISSKKIDDNISDIEIEFKELFDIIKDLSGRVEEDDDIKDLINILQKYKGKYNNIFNKLSNLDFIKLDLAFRNIMTQILSMDKLNDTRKKNIIEFGDEVYKPDTSIAARNYEIIKAYTYIMRQYNSEVKITLGEVSENEIKINSALGFKWEKIYNDLLIIDELNSKVNFNKYILLVKEISDQLSMLHEKIEEYSIKKKLKLIDTYKGKKKYIDDMYENQRRTNFVKKSYQANYKVPNDKFHWDVKFIDGKQYLNKVDLFVGGSPCQSFSLVGKQRGLEDTRGTLFYEYARLISEIKPKVFIYENVKGVLSNDDGKTWETMKTVFKSLDYNFKYKILNAKDYGIPQNRERLFVIGFRNDLGKGENFKFPEKQELDKTMKDFLLDNVSGKYYLNEKGVKFVTSEKNLNKSYTQINGDIQLCQKKNQQFNWHGDFVFVEEQDEEPPIEELEKYFLSEKIRKYVLSSGTKGFYSKPEIDLDVARPLLTTMHKMHRAGVDNYVTSEGRIRKLTPRETLRLMGFCDSFKIVVSDTQVYQQAGNSIVVDVLIALMDRILEEVNF